MVKRKLKLTDSRTALKPFTYPWAYDYWLAHEQMHWLHSEVEMVQDIKDWQNSISEKEKYFLTNIFRFFTQSDIDVAGGYVNNYLPILKQPELRMMLLGFAAREAVHIAAYSHLIETLGMPDSTYTEFLKYQAMKDKHEYIEQISELDSTKNIAQQIAIFSAFTEGMQLFSSFVMLLNFPRRGKMKGMGQIISWSILDEQLHCEAMIKTFRTFIEENRDIWKDDLKSELYSIAEKMVELEDAFIDICYDIGECEGLEMEDLKNYIRYICDRRLIAMGLKGIFKVKKNPIPWVDEMISAPQHTNFFENRATAYAKGALSGSWSEVWAN
jgi:ribonucleoside-diphosphate reductase beta chain